MRFERHGDMDLFATTGEQGRNERLRELVDELPPLERKVIERCYFGGEHLITVAREEGVSKETISHAHRNALEALRAQVLEDDAVGPLPAAAFLSEP